MKPLWKFLIFNVISIILTISIYAIGYEYDKENKLYPEAYYFSYDASIIVYGKRWERIAQTLAVTLAVIDIVIIFIWYRNKFKEKNTSLLK